MAEKVLSVFIDESGDFVPYDFHYICAKIRKDECPDVITLTAKISKAIADTIRYHQDFWEQFNRIIVYYDNGQIELTKILTSGLTRACGTVLSPMWQVWRSMSFWCRGC